MPAPPESAPEPGRLPFATTRFVGRRRELDDTRRWLASARLVTLTGVGGVGKTRLALEAARRLRGTFKNSVWLADLAPLTDEDQLAPTVARAVGAADQSVKNPVDQLMAYLAGKHGLLVLDNCEHLVTACARLVDRILRGTAGVRVLATSRQALDIAGEQLLRVQPLATPEPGAAGTAESVLRYDAVSMLVDRAVTQRADFAVTEDNWRAVARLSARLDGIPLAIELGATRLRSLSVDQLADRLDDRFAVLTAGDRSALPRQQTLRALIDWSHHLCTDDQRTLWQRAAVFAGGFDLDAAEAVCSGPDLPASAVLNLLDGLVAQSILQCDVRGGSARYRMLETIREYGLRLLRETGQEQVVRRRHRDHYFARAEATAAAWCGPGQQQGLARLRADHDNLRAALECSLTEPVDTTAALSGVAALRHHWYADGFLSEGRRWLDRALAVAAGPAGRRADALWVAAWVSLLQGDHPAADRRLDECERLAAQVDGPMPSAFARSLRGTAALFCGDLGTARRSFTRAIEELHGSGNTGGALAATFQLAHAIAQQGDLDEAAAVCREGLAIAESRGECWARSCLLWTLGYITWLGGDPQTAAALTRGGLDLQRGFNDHVGSALMIELLAWVAADRSQFGRAAELLGAAASVWREIGTGIVAFGPFHAEHHEHCARVTAGALPAAEHESAFGTGYRLRIGEAIAFAIGDPPPAPADQGPNGLLTRREREVAQLVAEGLTNRAVAERLVLSPRTVDGHLEHILAKLGFSTRAQVAAWVAGQREPSAQSPGTG